MITENTIRSLIAEKIEGTEYYILELEIKPGNNIRVELESMGPVSISDCVDISRQIEHNLDREAEDFSLQVSSPGIDKPLRDHRQYVKNIGRDLKVKLTGGEEVEGELLTADEKGIKLHTSRKERVPGKKKKILIEEELDLSYPEVKEAKIKINFK
ncbi:ribosome assembly cofactor RimP [Cryomorphaceae bacterium 1068]|nr:ribosome assembly cofactor RimP [Cryomorphaceae bacterium 1068]